MVILITGGQRSGKSRYAQDLALNLTPNPVYLATSRIWDEEFRQRVLRHQADRGPEWTNIEEEKYLSRHSLEGRVIVIDCVTLWSTNFFFDQLGMGGVSVDETQRKFTDLQGWVNQYIASQADEVILMVSGIPVAIKNNIS